MQKTIYISNEEIWESIKHMAGDKSISRYLVDLHETNVLRQMADVERQGIIRSQIELIDAVPDRVMEIGNNEDLI